MNYFVELTIAGISRGSIYALLALGYTMVYGIIGMINFAHGEIYMLSAFVALVCASVLQILGFGKLFVFLITILVAITYGCAYGLTVERMAYKPPKKLSKAYVLDFSYWNVHLSAKLCTARLRLRNTTFPCSDSGILIP